MRDRGFTLLEVLVALVVLGLLVAGLAQGLRFGLGATERQERFAAERGDLDAVDRLLRRIVASMDPGTARDPSPVQGAPGAFGFVTDLGPAASGLPTTEAQVSLGVEGGQLVLRWRPLLRAARFGPPPPLQTVVLLERVDRLELSYWGPVGEAPPSWQREWGQKTLPLLVRMRLVFPPGSGRRWPDIVAGPIRPRPVQ